MIYILGGGTFSHVRSHLAISAPAFGGTARQLYNLVHEKTGQGWGECPVELHLTKMANSSSDLVTNDDVAELVDRLVADPTTKMIFFNVALCDFDGDIITKDHKGDSVMEVAPGKYAKRLKTRDGFQDMLLTPAEKIIGRIRKERKDIFVVGFKTTAGASSDEQYLDALNLLKSNSLNLVLANDIVTRNNMIVAPEETRYCETTDRKLVLDKLTEMALLRQSNTFTRSTVVRGDLVDFQTDDRVPDNLRKVVNHLVERGAYFPFRNATAGHFAVRVDDGRCLTSRRKTNYTVAGGLDLVEVEYDGLDKVIAYGAKPSVGGQSQRIVFTNHDRFDCIVHFHCAMKANARDAARIGHGDQFPNECGSHQCGASTALNLRNITGDIMAVMLDNHGPNIVFTREVDADEVIDFIEANFDLTAKTGGSVSSLIAETV